MRKALIAGFWYFAAGFGAGFALGTVRVLVVEPRLGPFAATLIEVPIMLAMLWLLSAFCVRRFGVPASASARCLMGGVALALLLCAETLLGLALGQSLAAQAGAYGSPAKLLGLSAQMLFSLFPLLQARLMRGA